MTFAAAIENLYAAFADQPRPSRIDGCPCCIDRKVSSSLHSKPLRQLTPDELSSYASSALLTVGTVADYLYFLPRILEISATERYWWPDPAVTGRVIRDTDLASWPAHRTKALHDFLHALVTHLLSSGIEDLWTVDDWLCAIARLGIDVRPFLDLIARSEKHILQYYDCNAGTLSSRNRLSNTFWEHPNAGHDQIVAWFATSPVFDVIHRAYGIVLPNPEDHPPA